MPTLADVCCRMLTYAGAPSRSFPDHTLQDASGDRGAGGSSPRLDTGHAGAQFTGFPSTKVQILTQQHTWQYLVHLSAIPDDEVFFKKTLNKTFCNKKRRMRAVASVFVLLY